MRFSYLWYEYAQTVNKGIVRPSMEGEHWERWSELFNAVIDAGLEFKPCEDGMKLSNGEHYKYEEPL